MWKYFRNKYVATIDKNYPPSGGKKIKQILMGHWSLIHNQPLLKTIFLKPRIISCTCKSKRRVLAIMRRYRKNDMGRPCRSVFAFILIHLTQRLLRYLTPDVFGTAQFQRKLKTASPVNDFTTSNGEKICTFECILITSVRGLICFDAREESITYSYSLCFGY